MGDESEQQSLLESRLKSRRYDDSTLRLLRLMLSSNKHPDPHLRTSLVQLFRSESASAIRALTPDKPIQLKLPTLDFFIHAFAILLDFQSCLSLRYEALTMRHTHPNPHFHVSSHEWIIFAQHAFHYAFYSVTLQACKNALLSFTREADAACLNIPETTTTTIDGIQRLMDAAIVSSSNHSVQAHTTEYVKKKTMILEESSLSKETESPASISFRNGIKLHNARKLLRLKNQDLHQSRGTSISN